MTEDHKFTGENPFLAGFCAGFAAGRSPRTFTQEDVEMYYEHVMEKLKTAIPELWIKFSQNESNN